MLYLALFPFPLPPYDPLDFELLNGDYRGFPAAFLSVRPFATISASLGLGLDWPAARYLAGNLVAFVPLGFLAPLIGTRWNSWLRIAGLGLAVSLFVEVAQMAESLLVSMPIHVADVDDLLLNTVGTVFGYGVLQGMRRARGGRARATDDSGPSADRRS